jgi:multidrug efflux system outer membrane protein
MSQIMRHVSKISFLLASLLAIAGCAVHTAPPAAAAHSTALIGWDASMYSDQAYDPRWWRQLDDPVLAQLEDAALAANHDVRSAIARLDEARAVFDEDRRALYPKATLGASADLRDQQVPGFIDQPVRINTYRAAFDASWELDLFGRVRAAIAAASANAESVEAALASMQVSVAADVARNYFELRGLQQRMAVLDRSLVNQREALHLTTVRRDEGIGEEQDVASASARVSAIEAEIPPIRVALAAHEYRLAVLTGRAPGELTVDLAPRAYPVLAKTIALGPPDQLLSRRPDVRAAERRLAATAATEGVAAADLYPRITIAGTLGLLAGRGRLFGNDSRAWAVTPALQWSAFDLGSARARLRGAQAMTREVLADYEKTMLLALEETDTALVTYGQRQERLVKLTDEVRESARAANIARARYREGVADYLLLLDAERTQLQAEDGAAQAETDVFTAFVGLYRALGGMRDTMPKGKESRSDARFRPGPEQSPGTLFQLRSGGSDR